MTAPAHTPGPKFAPTAHNCTHLERDLRRCNWDEGQISVILRVVNAYDGLTEAIQQDCKDADCKGHGFQRPDHRCWHMKAIDKAEAKP